MAWTKIDSDGDWTEQKHKATFILDSVLDIVSPPSENSQLDAGSIAYTADMANIWQKNASGQWVKVGD